jgi:hypothetical protein
MARKGEKKTHCIRGHQRISSNLYGRFCKLCQKIRTIKYYTNSGIKERAKIRYHTINKFNLYYKWRVYVTHLNRKFKLTELQYLQMLWKTKGCCYSCFEQTLDICVDHCHKTEKVRGLLCQPCNKALGTLSDNRNKLMALSNYIQNYV